MGNKRPKHKGSPPATKRQPRIERSPVPTGKSPRIAEPVSTNHENPAWKLEILDASGPWGKDSVSNDHLWSEIFPKLRNYESMTWAQIEQDRKRNHAVEVSKLIPEARKRLQDLKLDDVDELFRFRLSGEMRVWGIRDRAYFKILWWDEHHQICPSHLKNT